ncbi:hypothetical protein N6H14_32205 [Paenibacillus sp. CC-CFT747]|nr:hypothetical protein N6H14_32205 [Paenibacillus sp. CC-CFT747]
MFECEFQLPKSSKGEFAYPVVLRSGEKLPSQVEKELSSLYIDWRKRVVFYAELEPSSMNRFDCTVEFMPEKPKPALQESGGASGSKPLSFWWSSARKRDWWKNIELGESRY